MTTESIGICKVIVDLEGSIEKLQSCLMFFLKRIAIAHNAPCLRGKERFFKCMVR
jgi:hypothetical protein